ncbi:zinc finger protein OZF-like isoform X2 [Cydia fagiglandana]|uniref:zinc finger protein OZF-like isoform X2 n=1 Tax=Cydia fagiglandana TaxID=1458189 RepID=UPI002FEE2C64
MSDICRFCLSFSSDNMRPLTDCDGIVYNSISFKIHIPLNNIFPTHICAICVNKLADFNKFCLQVQKNEETLLNKLNKGKYALEKFYEQLKNEIKQNNTLIQENQEAIDSLKENEVKIKTEVLNSDYDTDFDPDDDLPLLKTRDSNIEDALNTNVTKTDKEISETLSAKLFSFKCLTCFEMFISQNKLLNHYNSVHKVKAEIKGNQYTQIDGDEKILYKCNKCDKTYENVRSVNKHAKTHCDENFHCKLCGRTYKTVSEIIRHGRAHNGKKMSCSLGCGFATVYSGALKSHERKHKEEYKYKCETCGKSFQVKTWYEQHQNIHTGAKPYTCDICGMAFHMVRYLKAHCSAVHPEASLKKRYVCVHCSKPCGTMKALTRHLKEHGITSSVLCDLCGKTLSSSEQLAIHRRLHTGVKPYSCSICHKAFAKRSNLKLHHITHSGERAHACAACGKRYSQRSTLHRHVHRHHSSEKKCTKCDAAFNSHTELEAHLKICS